MRLGHERIKELQAILSKEFGLECTDEHAQEIGLAVMRFVIAKTQHQLENTNSDKEIS